MSKGFKLFLAVLALSSCALAQRHNAQPLASESDGPEASTTCKITFSSGSGQTATQFCVTQNGNITQFSVNGLEMIDVGLVGEGYGLCDTSNNTRYYDYASHDSGNWLSSVFNQKGVNVVVTRKSSDGIWQLKQTITNQPATSFSPGSAKITMALTNLSGVDRSVALLRWADVDADGDAANNDFDFTSQTAYGTDPEGFFAGRGLSITNSNFPPGVTTGSFTLAKPDAPDPCNAGADGAPQPFHGDGSIVQYRLFNAAHGTTTTVVSTYKPI
jgi:hypothetical protein